MSTQTPALTRRSVTGLVTKLVGDGSTYGFINDEIFFPQTNVTGGPASVGDQVYAECEYSAHLPIKWNATSVRIVGKSSGQQPNPSPMVDIQQQDPRQQPFNPTQPVAVTYQQHRQQQRLQRIDDKPDSNLSKLPQQQQQQQNPPRLLDQSINQTDFYNMNDPRSFNQPNQAQQQQQQPQQTQPDTIQPFQDQPMGPPKFTYTSQLGSAFVQNQFVPPPFIPQPQAPLLPQQPLLPPNQAQNNQGNQRHNNQQNKPPGGPRFNNQGDKIDRQANRNNNRNNRNDRARSRDRDNTNRNYSNNNNKSHNESNNNARDRSSGRANKRDDVPVRPSPPPHSSARSSASVSSDRGTKGRRHYEGQNIPKTQIMVNMNSCNMKQRCPSSIHVPSDLKEVIVNKFFRLDIKNIPKPLNFTIEKSETPAEKTSEVTDKEQNDIPAADQGNTQESQVVTESNSEEVKKEENAESNTTEQQTAFAPAKMDIKMNHKYGVKIILISLPELNSIYHSVFGSNLDSYSSESKSNKRLDETISLLCNKGSNGGYSLIGGRFDPNLDGFVEGSTNEFEKQGRQPDLIATCKRLVLEQTGLDLSPCKSWTLLSTFLYNNRNDYFSSKASVEYSFIYMPQIWTMAEDKPEKTLTCSDESEINPTTESHVTDNQTELAEEPTQEVKREAVAEDAPMAAAESDGVYPSVIPPPTSLENLADLKVADLKLELDKREVKYKPNAKKAELVALLRESIENLQRQESEGNTSEPPMTTSEEAPALDQSLDKPADLSEDLAMASESGENEQAKEEASEQPIKSEGVDGSDKETDPDVVAAEGDSNTETASCKRKEPDTEAESDAEVAGSKKVCTESSGKKGQVSLIKDSFIVRAKGDQVLTLVPLQESTQVARYDQFEMSVATNILKESLVQHLSEYVFTTLIECHRQRTTSQSVGSGSNSSSSQDTNSDSNNNNNQTANKSAAAFKNPSTSAVEPKVNLKELPVDRYINLAFSYFDSSHVGYVYSEDLSKLFNNTGLSISKRALIALIGDGEKFHYRTLADLSPKLSPTYLFEFPEQFSRLPNSNSIPSSSDSQDSNFASSCRIVEFKGVTYDLEKLVQEVRDAETTRVNLYERFNYAIANSDKQAEEIHVLEVNQKSLAKAIKSQNDEICALKRERDSMKKKLETLRKGIKGSVTSLSDLIKEDK